MTIPELLMFAWFFLVVWSLFGLKAAKGVLRFIMCAIGICLALGVVAADLLAGGIEWLERKFNDLHVRLFEKL